MKRVVGGVIVILLVVFVSIWLILDREQINCSSFRESISQEIFGCKLTQNFGDGLVLKVANLRHYFFIFNKYLFLDIVQVINGKSIHHLYLARIYNSSWGISINIRPTRDISTDPNEKHLLLSIKDFKKWLDNNNFRNKQVVALLFTKPGEKTQYLVGISVYAGDVKN